MELGCYILVSTLLNPIMLFCTIHVVLETIKLHVPENSNAKTVQCRQYLKKIYCKKSCREYPEPYSVLRLAGMHSKLTLLLSFVPQIGRRRKSSGSAKGN